MAYFNVIIQLKAIMLRAWIIFIIHQLITTHVTTVSSTTTSGTTSNLAASPSTTMIANTDTSGGSQGYKKSAVPTKKSKVSGTRGNMIVGLSIGFGTFGGLLILCCVCKCICTSNSTRNRINPNDISKRLGLPA